MCDFEVQLDELLARFGSKEAHIRGLLSSAAAYFGDLVQLTDKGLRILPEGEPLTRIIARHFDAYDMSSAGHASAI